MKLFVPKISEENTLKIKWNSMAKTKMRVYSLDEMIDKHVGKKGTAEREKFDYELNMRRMGRMIKEARKQRKLTQSELGKLVGVQKAQISKLERGANSATIGSILKVFKALQAEINFNIKIDDKYLQLQ
jgi:HTH-type transcriptional regulator / antitoxin HipB